MIAGVDPALVGLLQVVADVQELTALEVVAEVTMLHVSRHKAGEPVIRDADRRLDLPVAAILQARLVEDSELEDDVAGTVALIRSWEYLAVVEEDNADPSLVALVDTELDLLILDGDADVPRASNARRVAGQVASLSFSVALVIWGDDGDLLPQLDEACCKLVDHDAETADSGPSP